MLCFISYYVFNFFSTVYMNNPPKKINKWDGFRTKKSMANQKSWDKAQILMAEAFKKCAKISLFLTPFFLLMEIVGICLKNETFFLIFFVSEGVVICFYCLYIHIHVNKQL